MDVSFFFGMRRGRGARGEEWFVIMQRQPWHPQIMRGENEKVEGRHSSCSFHSPFFPLDSRWWWSPSFHYYKLLVSLLFHYLPIHLEWGTKGRERNGKVRWIHRVRVRWETMSDLLHPSLLIHPSQHKREDISFFLSLVSLTSNFFFFKCTFHILLFLTFSCPFLFFLWKIYPWTQENLFTPRRIKYSRQGYMYICMLHTPIGFLIVKIIMYHE